MRQAYEIHLIKVSGAPWLIFYSLGLELLDRIWMVPKVVALVVAFFIGCVGSTFFASPLYIPRYMFLFFCNKKQKWHQLHPLFSLIGLLDHHSFKT
jgi:hypothetical protein